MSPAITCLISAITKLNAQQTVGGNDQRLALPRLRPGDDQKLRRQVAARIHVPTAYALASVRRECREFHSCRAKRKIASLLYPAEVVPAVERVVSRHHQL